MENENTNTKVAVGSALWRARMRAGLERKQVARLLGQKSIDGVSRYESGRQLPSLRTTLKLEIIYGAPAAVLLEELSEELRREIDEKRRQAPKTNAPAMNPPSAANEASGREEFCSYAESLDRAELPDDDLELVHRHAVALVNRFSAYRSGREAPSSSLPPPAQRGALNEGEAHV